MPKQHSKTVQKSDDAPEPRAWQRMLSGRRLDILHPSPLDIEIEDIAHGLARVTRWNGQTRGKYGFSVAQHCVLVERLVRLNAPKTDQKWCLAALLHDAPEYVIGDMITPFKYALGGIYRDIEHRLDTAVSIRFGLPPHLPDAVQRTIKRADRMAAWIEATQIAGFAMMRRQKFLSSHLAHRHISNCVSNPPPMLPPHSCGALPFLAVRKNKNSLGFRPQCGCVTLLLFDFAHFGDVFGFAKRHAIGAHTTASKVKTAT
ncbi:MAG: YfbR-like 5'-deoxynucleotidase [Candidatus Puniceispirillaceae bacterium]